MRHASELRHRFLVAAVAIALLAFQGSASAQKAGLGPESSLSDKAEAGPRTSGLLRELNGALVRLTEKVTPSVVQIMVTSYGPIDTSTHTGDVALVARQHGIGSGVIVDSSGYIMTNAHVVEGAQRIRVALSRPATTSPINVEGQQRILDAKLVGVDKDSDLALLKVDAPDLPVLTLATTHPVNPGELVLAVGSPEGLQSTVTMGVVSSVARQPDPDQPAVYIQTDAPINPGNSGGPLIDIDGFVVGLNTMILTEGGGSEGLGFAIPARTVQFVYENLRKYGHVHRTEIEASAQEITPALAEGLGLSQNWGVIISDVDSGGPAASAGLKPGDVVLAVDGRRVRALPDLAAALYLHPPVKPVLLEVLRGSEKVSLVVPAQQYENKPSDLADLIDPNNLIDRLGVFVRDFDDSIRSLLPSGLHIDSGVLVVAQSPELNSYNSSLRGGDVLLALNRTPIESVRQLKWLLRGIKSGQSVVLQVERAGKLQYIPFDWGD